MRFVAGRYPDHQPFDVVILWVRPSDLPPRRGTNPRQFGVQTVAASGNAGPGVARASPGFRNPTRRPPIEVAIRTRTNKSPAVAGLLLLRLTSLLHATPPQPRQSRETEAEQCECPGLRHRRRIDGAVGVAELPVHDVVEPAGRPVPEVKPMNAFVVPSTSTRFSVRVSVAVAGRRFVCESRTSIKLVAPL